MSLTMNQKDIKVLFSEEEIQTRINEIAKLIDSDYKDTENLIVVGVLKGALLFTADLVRKLKTPSQLEFISLSSYGNETTSSGSVRSYDLSLPDLTDKEILVVEDIVDSGRTADFLMNFFKGQAKTKSVKLVSLLNKPSKRLKEFEAIEPDYCCFTVDDKFIIGYGLDFEQKYRDLPYLGYVEGLV